jgi:putative tRNA adenosine deaminase-associated protein
VAYVATALARSAPQWRGSDIDIEELEDLDTVVDALRDLASGKEPVLLLVEENDEWFGIVRLDGDGEPQLFLSDSRVLAQSEIASVLFSDAPVAVVELDPDEETAISAEGDPIGDPDLLADLGTPASELLALCAEEGLLPGDILTTISERAGCLEPLEELRGL